MLTWQCLCTNRNYSCIADGQKGGCRREAGEPLPPPPKTAIAGPEYFGLTHPDVILQIESLDLEHLCSKYWNGKQVNFLPKTDWLGNELADVKAGTTEPMTSPSPGFSASHVSGYDSSEEVESAAQDRLAYGQVYGISPERKGCGATLLPRAFPAPTGGAARRRRGRISAEELAERNGEEPEEAYAGSR